MARDVLGMSVSEMARVLGVHRNTLDKWLRGEQNAPAVAISAADMLIFLYQRGLLDDFVNDD